MSRSGYVDDLDSNLLNLWRGTVSRSINGKRGQRLLRDLAAAMDVMPVKRLITEELVLEGEYCALGVVGAARGLDLEKLDPTEPEDVADALDIACCLAQEIVYENDECGWKETPEQRWARMRGWVAVNLKQKPE